MKLERKIIIFSIIILFIAGAFNSGVLENNQFNFSWPSVNLPKLALPWAKPPLVSPEANTSPTVKVTVEESVIIDVVEQVSPSVVTVGIKKTQSGSYFEIDPFNFFSPFRRSPGRTEPIEQDIGSGFIVSADGLIVTNKHVVSDTQAVYKVILKDDKSFNVEKIYRDPTNDIAILKISATGLKPVELGDSTKIKVGQLAIAIGTALGEFRSTVTTGVISGVGRGITAGSPFEGYAERLDNVIQTDAAINPGNSGGPLLNSGGQVIGVNTAVSGEGQNIGFAIPINVVREALDNFNKTGQFDRPFLGVRYKVITKDIALLNDVPEGVYIIEVVENSPAETAGLEPGDIITKIDNQRLTGDNIELAKIIGTKKVGETIEVVFWRDGDESSLTIKLANQN
jgi:S1-C subfamily serine protease